VLQGTLNPYAAFVDVEIALAQGKKFAPTSTAKKGEGSDRVHPMALKWGEARL